MAVIELRGPGAGERIREICRTLRGVKNGAVQLVRLEFAGEALDEAIVWLDADERVEVQLHGSPVLARRVLAHLQLETSPGSDQSLEERAAELLAAATNDAAARILLDQEMGALRRELERILVLNDVTAARVRLEELCSAGRRAGACITPLKVALVGPVNAGKSTLFNALVGERRAIVSSHAGSTRDVLTSPASLGEWPVEVFDTAGERPRSSEEDQPGELECAGQELAQGVPAQADWVLRLWPADGAGPRGPKDLRGAREAWIESRADLAPVRSSACVARVAAGPEPHAAVAAVTELFCTTFGLTGHAWRPGAPAPFDARSREFVWSARLALESSGEDWRVPLRSLLSD